MLRATHGDRGAITLLVDRHYAPLFGYLFRLTHGNRTVAEDLVHDALMRLIAASTYTPGRSVKPWLYAIATNLVRDRYRLRVRRGVDGNLESAEHLPGGEDPGVEAVRSEDERGLRLAIASLGEEQRAAIVLRFYQGLSLAEIADVLGIPVGTVKSRLSNGTRRLRELLLDREHLT